jgi:peptide/nickel transport system substrate-binding protein
MMRKSIFIALLLIALMVLLQACGQPSGGEEVSQPEAPEVEEVVEEPEAEAPEVEEVAEEPEVEAPEVEEVAEEPEVEEVTEEIEITGVSRYIPLDLASEEVGSGPRLIYLWHEYPFTLDPQNTSAFVGAMAMELFDTLVTYEVDWDVGVANQLKIKPRLAESWEFSDDGTVLTFHLVENAKFWDGTPVTAEDVKFSIERGLVGRMGWGATQIESGGIFSPDQMEVVDDYTFQVTYPDGPNRFALRNFATLSLTIISKDACLDNATPEDPWCVEWIKKDVMGSGPYKLGDYSQDEYLIIEANKDYWGEPKPYFSEIMFRIVPDPQSRMLLLQSGEAHLAHLTQKEYLALDNDPVVNLFTASRWQDVAVLRWKEDYPPFDDMKIREAVIRAIPYDKLVTDACQGFCSPTQNIIGPNTLGYWEEPLFTTDIEAAKQLVAESKYAGNVPSFEILLPEQLLHVPAAVLIQDALREIGITMDIKLVTQNAFDEIAWDKRALNTEIWSMGPWWNDFMYWMFWMYTTTSATNHIQFSDEMVDEYVAEALLIPPENVDEFMQYQDPVIQMLIDERLAAPLYEMKWTLAHSKELCSLALWPWGQTNVSYLRACP